MRAIAIICLVLISFLSKAQIRDITEAEFDQHVDYLERKLTFTYYSPELEAWWINKFQYNRETEVFIIKNTQAKNPKKLTGKKYIEKRFKLWNMNPFEIEKIHMDENMGRMVKGEEIVLHTFKHKKLVSKTINTQKRSPQSFLQISIPKYMEDSTHISDTMVVVFQEIIKYATDLKRSDDPNDNMLQIFEIMNGDHLFENGVGEAKRFTKRLNPFALQFEEYQNREKLRDGFFGYDPTDDHYYELSIGSDGKERVDNYHLDEQELVLRHESDSTISIHFPNRSRYFYKSGGVEIEMNPQ